MSSTIDDALERLKGTSTEVLGGGDPNHGPMTAEALGALGRDERVVPWVDGYRTRLGLMRPPTLPIIADSWRSALGAVDRIADWLVFYRSELRVAKWTTVLATWLPRLMPGAVSAGTHGLIRTAHIARALRKGETPQRLEELATALAYWASFYREHRGSPPRLRGTTPLAIALECVPRVFRARLSDGLPREVIFRVGEHASFLDAIESAQIPETIEDGISEMTEVGARAYLTNAGHNPLVLLHTVTAPAALRLLLPHIEPATQREAFAAVYHCVAAQIALFAGDAPFVTADEGTRTSLDEIIDRSIATADPHAIKFVEACARENLLNGRPIYLAAALDWAERVRESRKWTPADRAAAGIGAG